MIILNKIPLILFIHGGVLEHIENPLEVFKKNYLLLKKNRFALHVIDLYSHTWGRFKNPYRFLSVCDWLWKLMYSNRGFINRYRASSYIRWAKESGFKVEILKVERYDDKDIDIDKLKRKFLLRFQNLDKNDILIDRIFLKLSKI